MTGMTSIIIYFICGLSLFLMGFSILLNQQEGTRYALGRHLIWLAAYGILHGMSEWLSMFRQVYRAAGDNFFHLIEPVQVAVLLVGFLCLFELGRRILGVPLKHTYGILITFSAGIGGILLYNSGSVPGTGELIVLARYFLAVPGGAMAAWGLMKYAASLTDNEPLARSMRFSAVALFFLIIVFVLGSGKTGIFPSTLINAQIFASVTGFPADILRALLALSLMLAVNYMLRVFMAEREQMRKEYINRLTEMVNRDSLTGLLNHSSFFKHLSENVIMAREQSTELSILLCDIDRFSNLNEELGYDVGDIVLKEVAGILARKTGSSGRIFRLENDKFSVVVSARPDRALTLAREIKQEIREKSSSLIPVESYSPLSVSIGIASYPGHGTDLNTLMKRAGDALFRAKYYKGNKVELYHSVLDELKENLADSEQSLVESIKTLIKIIDVKDRYTFGHSERVMNYCLWMSEKLRLDLPSVTRLRYAALLHDIGKIQIDEAVLNKMSSLSQPEWDQIKQHPLWGGEILASVPSLREVIPLIIHHHERLDGQGYPMGLKGEEIDLCLRILIISDCFDAMTTNRPYKTGKSFERAARELIICSGTQFDPGLVGVFLEILREKGMLMWKPVLNRPMVV